MVRGTRNGWLQVLCLVVLVGWLVGCTGVDNSDRYAGARVHTKAEINHTPYPGSGDYVEEYNPNAYAYWLRLRRQPAEPAIRDFPSRPLRGPSVTGNSLKPDDPRQPYFTDPFYLPGSSDPYWNGRAWVYPLTSGARTFTQSAGYSSGYYSPYYYPWWLPDRGYRKAQREAQERAANPDSSARPAGSSFNGGPVHTEQGFERGGSGR